MDDNEEIIRRLGTLSKSPPIVEIQARLDIGKSRYKHGVRAHDDTTQWGTKTNSWLENSNFYIKWCVTENIEKLTDFSKKSINIAFA